MQTLSRSANRQDLDRKLDVLLSDYGYAVRGDRLIKKAIPGFCGERVHRLRVRSRFDACELLIPIIADQNFTDRFRKVYPHA